MEFPAHIRIQEDGTRNIQSVAEHCRGAARCAAESLGGIGLSKAAYLTGLLHDLGKATPEFQAYIESAVNGEAVPGRPADASYQRHLHRECGQRGSSPARSGGPYLCRGAAAAGAVPRANAGFLR